MANKRFYSFLAAVAAIAFAVDHAGCAEPPGKFRPVDARSSGEWLRGVPRGFRLISFDLPRHDRSWHGLETLSRVDVMLAFVASDNGATETTTLFENLEILEHEPAHRTHGSRLPIRRLIVALTPGQTDRLRQAAAYGTLQIKEAHGHTRQAPGSSPTWKIATVDDRTEAIEARLRAAAVKAEELERPTLASPRRVSAVRSPRVIAVPIEIETEW